MARHPEHEKYVARLLLLDIPYITVVSGCKRWYVRGDNNVTYKVIGIYPNGQIAMYNERMLKKGLVDTNRFVTT